MTVSDFIIFAISATISYSIWNFVWYFVTRNKYNKYLDSVKEPVDKMQFLYEKYRLNKLYWKWFETHRNLWIYRQKVYDTTIMLKCIIFLVLGIALWLAYLYVSTTEYSVYLSMKL